MTIVSFKELHNLVIRTRVSKATGCAALCATNLYSESCAWHLLSTSDAPHFHRLHHVVRGSANQVFSKRFKTDRAKSWPRSTSQIWDGPECGRCWNHRLQMVSLCWALRGQSSTQQGWTHLWPQLPWPSTVTPRHYDLGCAPMRNNVTVKHH